MRIETIGVLKDNFAYLIHCDQTKETAVVDPSEAGPVIQALKKQKWKLSKIFNTHHHWDHVDGNLDLIHAFPTLEVYGHESDKGRIPGQTHFVNHGDHINLGRHTFRILHNPGHTRGAITYVCGHHAFTGDTLFSAGCGRLFEGTAQDMKTSLNEVIGQLPVETQLYFGHEYTVKNLQFALSLEPKNKTLQSALSNANKIREAGQWTTPTTLAFEIKHSPFFRSHEPGLKKALGQTEDTSDLETFKEIRERRNHY